MIDQKTFLHLKEIGLSNACDKAQYELEHITTYEEFIKLGNAPEYVYHMFDKYKEYIDKSIISELEDVIATDPAYSYLYAIDVIQGPWEKGEDIIATDLHYLEEYNEFLESLK